MRILLHSPYYAPELISIGKYNAEMASWLRRRGHDVRVFTAAPHYPSWSVAEGYSAWQYRHEVIDGVPIWRCPAWIPSRPGAAKRVLFSLTHLLSSLPLLLWQWRWKPQIAMAVEPPLLSFAPAWMAARLCGARTWLHVQDLEVDAAFELGHMRGAAPRRWALRLESALLRRADRVSTISSRMAGRLLAKGLAIERVLLVPNWADELPPDPPGVDYRRQLGLRDGQRLALYAGNMAAKQGLETVLAAAALLQRREDIVFVLVGEGPARASLQAAAQRLARVLFLPLQPYAQLGALLRGADLHLLPQRAAAADLVMPSKLGGMFASGRPTVAGAHADTELAQVMQGRGVVVPPEDAAALAAAIEALCDDPARAAQLGAAALSHARAEMDRDTVLQRLELQMLELIAAKG